jgi:hypothetical protein
MLLGALLPLLTGCIDEGPTSHPADEDDIRAMTEAWTGVPLPERLTLVDGDYVSDFLDPSLSAIFDAAPADVDRFVAALGTRTVRKLVADCRVPQGPVVFTEAEDPRIVGSSPDAVVPADTDGPSRIASLAGLVGAGSIERCRDVVRVDARPRGTFVAVTIQARSAEASRGVLSVVTT